MTDEGNMDEYLGILITHGDDNSFRMSYPFLIYGIIASITKITDARSVCSPVIAGKVLNKDLEGELRRENWNYGSQVNCTHPKIVFAVHLLIPGRFNPS